MQTGHGKVFSGLFRTRVRVGKEQAATRRSRQYIWSF